MDEFALIEIIKQKTYRQSGLIKGIGDDGAVFRNRSSDIVTCVDTFVDRVHFSQETMSFYHVGYKCLAVNISDLCAMGASPSFYLVSIVVPDSVGSDYIKQIYDGMDAFAKRYAIDLIGGDTVSGEQLMITVTAIGNVPEHRVRYRSTAQIGDYIFVTGTLGDAQAGLEILLHDKNITNSAYFIKRHRMPNIHVRFVESLRDINRVTLNDISDGLASELYEIAESSNKVLLIEDEKIPLHKHIKQFPRHNYDDWKFYAGEDFELVGTIPKSDWTMLEKCAKKHDVPVTIIGEVIGECSNDGEVFVRKKGKESRLSKKGYRHYINGK